MRAPRSETPATASPSAGLPAPGPRWGSVTATPYEAGDSVAYEITEGGQAGLFAIEGVTGAITTKRAPAATDSNTHTLTVLATDGHGQGAAATVEVTLE